MYAQWIEESVGLQVQYNPDETKKSKGKWVQYTGLARWP